MLEGKRKMKNALEVRNGETIIKLRSRQTRICYICKSYEFDKGYCQEFKRDIKEAKEAATCEGYNCVFNAHKVNCKDCAELSYGYYCEVLRGPAPYRNRSKECSSFREKKL